MRNCILAGFCLALGSLGLSSCSLRSDAPPPRFLEAALPATPAMPVPASALDVRLGGVDSEDMLRLDLLRYSTNAEVLRDPTWRWIAPPAKTLRQRLELSASAHGIALRDRADLPVISATLLRYGIIDGATSKEFGVQMMVRCRLADGSERSQVVESSAAISESLPGTTPAVVGTLLNTVSTAAWSLVRSWCSGASK